jgi:hypothetical protein
MQIENLRCRGKGIQYGHGTHDGLNSIRTLAGWIFLRIVVIARFHMAKQSSILDVLRIRAAKHISEQNLVLDAFQSKGFLFYGIKRFGIQGIPR